jgi:hypothetical protein
VKSEELHVQEFPVIPVNRVVDKKRIIRKKWRAEEEERHKVGSILTLSDSVIQDGATQKMFFV